MSSLITDEIRAKAEIYYGKEACKKESRRLLREVGLPNGLLPIEDADECGYVEETGFVWLKQKKRSEHRFEKIGKLVSYGTEVTAQAEPNKIKKLTGVKVKELFLWITLVEITVPYKNADKVTFKSSAGPSRTFPAEAFMVEDDDKVIFMSVDEKEKERDANDLKKPADNNTVLVGSTQVKEV